VGSLLRRPGRSCDKDQGGDDERQKAGVEQQVGEAELAVRWKTGAIRGRRRYIRFPLFASGITGHAYTLREIVPEAGRCAVHRFSPAKVDLPGNAPGDDRMEALFGEASRYGAAAFPVALRIAPANAPLCKDKGEPACRLPQSLTFD
jgi:hypothetical protein